MPAALNCSCTLRTAALIRVFDAIAIMVGNEGRVFRSTPEVKKGPQLETFCPLDHI